MTLSLLTVLVVKDKGQESNGNDELINIQSNLVRLSFIAPKNANSQFEVFDGNQKVRDFQIITPTTKEKIDWIFYLDVSPKDQPRFAFAPLRRQLRKAAEVLSAPTIIINLEQTTLERSKSIAGIPDHWNILLAKNTVEAMQIAAQQLSKLSASRKAFLWLTTEESEMNQKVLNKLPPELTDNAVFTFMITMSPRKLTKLDKQLGKKEIHIGISNLTLNNYVASLTRDNLLNIQIALFVEQCNQLNLIYFQTDNKTNEVSVYGRDSLVNWRIIQKKIY